MTKKKKDGKRSEVTPGDGLPWQAFALVGDKEEPETWKLPHHTKTINRAIQGKIGLERTVDWEKMPAAVAAISRGGYQGERVHAEAHEILAAAQHLAGHYRKANKPLPNALAVLV